VVSVAEERVGSVGTKGIMEELGRFSTEVGVGEGGGRASEEGEHGVGGGAVVRGSNVVEAFWAMRSKTADGLNK
jgi:hypothetical protein